MSTPAPPTCLRCNRMLKFGVLIPYARQQGADFLATGITCAPRNRWHLASAARGGPAQGPILCAVRLAARPTPLAAFPLGEMTKEQVRAFASQRGLPVAERPESQDVCFLQDNDYRRFLRERPRNYPPRPHSGQAGKRLGTPRIAVLYSGPARGWALPPAPAVCAGAGYRTERLIVGYAEELGHDPAGR